MKKLLLVVSIMVLAGMVMLNACAPKSSAPVLEAMKNLPQALSSSGSGGADSRPGPVEAPSSGAGAVPEIQRGYGGGGLPPGPPGSGRDTIGLAAGGAKDIGNFRENIKNNYLPLPTDVTYEGLFYDYYFDTGRSAPSRKLFSPAYSYAVTRDPLSRKTEYYLAVGLNSGLKESDFQRKKLNLAIVLDNSGSMAENFNQYYYDRFGKKIDAYAEEGISRSRKMDSANESVEAILNQLDRDDHFAIATFNSSAFLVKAMTRVKDINMRAMKNDVLDIRSGGSTNMAAGMDMGTQQFRGLFEMDGSEYENRIIFLTDAQPNTGDTSSSGLMDMVRRNAGKRIYTTFIGIGVDFNTQLVEEITKIKGANYYSVHSPKEFRQRMEEEFDYMVTPLVFDVRLNFESRGWRIEKVFGSPEADEASGELMRINTLFPSKREGGQTKGGLVLLKLRKTSSSPDERVYLKVSYEDRNGRRDTSDAIIYLEGEQPEFFGNSGIRKGILLTRYAALLKNWMIDERQYMQYRGSWTSSAREDTGIVIPVISNISRWERQSLPLVVSEPYRKIFRDFSRYFEDEMNSINDDTLNQELRILNSLSKYR